MTVSITPLDAWIAGKTGRQGLPASREAISRYQLLRLNDTLKRARGLSPFYRRHLAGARPLCLTRLEDFTHYPLLTAGDVATHALQMVCGSQSQISRVVTLNTSGTTGQPKSIYFSSLDQELTVDFFQAGMSTLVRPGDKTLILLPGERSGSVGDLLFTALCRSQVLPYPYGLIRDLPEAVSAMCREKATCLVGVPVQALAMARYWEQWHGDNPSPRCALLSTDYVPAVVVSELKRIWNCEVYEHYGMTEMGLGGGMECAAHNGYHLREADLYFEVIDPSTGQPLPDGQYGEVVFTTLTRQGMPLIRYRTGDISRFIPEPCPCGTALRRLERVCYRQAGWVDCGSGQRLAMADLDEALLAMPAVVDFSASIIQGDTARLKVVLTVMDNAQQQDEMMVFRTLRQIPAIRAAEHCSGLTLEAEFAPYQAQQALAVSKRMIAVTDPGKGGVSRAE